MLPPALRNPLTCTVDALCAPCPEAGCTIWSRDDAPAAGAASHGNATALSADGRVLVVGGVESDRSGPTYAYRAIATVFDTASGAMLLRHAGADGTSTSAVATDGARVYVGGTLGAGGAFVEAIDVATGATSWSMQLEGARGVGRMAAGDGSVDVLVGGFGGEGSLLRVSGATGETLARVDAQILVEDLVRLDATRVAFVGRASDGSGAVEAHDVAAPSAAPVRFASATSTAFRHGALAGGDTLVVVGEGPTGNAVLFDAATLAVVAETSSPVHMPMGLSVADGRAVVVGWERTGPWSIRSVVAALDAETGALAWSLAAPQGTWYGAAVAGPAERVYVTGTSWSDAGVEAFVEAIDLARRATSCTWRAASRGATGTAGTASSRRRPTGRAEATKRFSAPPPSGRA